MGAYRAGIGLHPEDSAIRASCTAEDKLALTVGYGVRATFGRLKHEWALLPPRVRGLDRVRLHADLTILAKLACALGRSRTLPLAA